MPKRTKRKILWIEDSAYLDLANLAGPVYMSRNYTLEIAIDATEAVFQLTQSKPFDVIIVDIRIPPGHDTKWINLYTKRDSQSNRARLGLEILHLFLGSGRVEGFEDLHIPAWISPDKVGVFTVEEISFIGKELDELNIKHYRQKTASISPQTLLELVETIDSQASGSHEGG